MMRLRGPEQSSAGFWVSSGRTGVGRVRGQVQLVGVVMEHQQAVEVLSSSQDALLSVPPRHGTVGEAVDRQGQPGLQLRPLQVTPGTQGGQGGPVQVKVCVSSPELLDEAQHVVRQQQAADRKAQGGTPGAVPFRMDQRRQEAAGRVLAETTEEERHAVT